jgi:tetratricopeptide (TPR) repeat protein
MTRRFPSLRPIGSILLATAAVTVLGCAKSAYYQTYVPSVAQTNGIERVAVADFDGLDRSGRMVAMKLSEGIVDREHFRLFERAELDRILAEREFNQSGLVDPRTVSDLKLLGVDALIFGVVDAYSVDSQTGVTKVERQVGTGRYREVERENGEGETEIVEEEITETILVDRGYVLREGTLGVTFRMANINTGEIVALKAETAQFSQRAWRDEADRLPTKDAILEDLSRQVAARFLNQIHPRWISHRVTFEDNDARSTEVGVSYAQAGLWNEALQAMQRAVQEAPHDDTTHYNLAVVADVVGDTQLARSSITRAIELNPQDKYIRWLAQVRQREGTIAR